MWIIVRTLMFTTARAIGAIALGGVIFWQVATHCGPQHGIAYIHVLTADVNVLVDGSTYYVESGFQSALECELRPGRHTLQMTRNGQVVFQEEFTMDRGKSMILMPYERSTREPTDNHAPVLSTTKSRLAARSTDGNSPPLSPAVLQSMSALHSIRAY